MKEVPPHVPLSRNPVAWLVVGIPLLTVVAGFVTLWLAASTSGTDSHPDPVKRTAQIQVASLAADENAARQGLRARLTVSGDGTLVAITPSPGPLAPVLQLVHPIESGLDRSIVFQPGPKGWRSAESLAGEHAWQLQLIAADGSWRLVGRYWPGELEVALEPAVAAP